MSTLTINDGHNFFKAHPDLIDLAKETIDSLSAEPHDAFSQKKIQILARWLDNRERFRNKTRKNNRLDYVVCKHGNCGGSVLEVPKVTDFVDGDDSAGKPSRNFHPCRAENLFKIVKAKYRVWFVRSGQEERVHDPIYGLLYLPDGRMFMPLAWLPPDEAGFANVDVRYVESLPAPLHAENFVHYEEFDLEDDGQKVLFREVLLASSINNAARMEPLNFKASYRKNEETSFWANTMPTVPTDQSSKGFRDPLTLNCYCRECDKGRLLPKRVAMGLTVLASIIETRSKMFSPKTRVLMQSYFAPTISPTQRDYKYTISTQNFVNDIMDKLKNSEIQNFDYKNEKDFNLGFWDLGQEKTRFTMAELADALPNNVYKLLMEHEIDTAAFGMWTTASFLGTATHNALDMAYVIHEPPDTRYIDRNSKTRSQAVDITRAYPGICTLSATAAYDFWVNRTLRTQGSDATSFDNSTSKIKFLCAEAALHPKVGRAFVFPLPHFKNMSGVIMRPDYYFPSLTCFESETNGQEELFSDTFNPDCSVGAFRTPLRAGQATVNLQVKGGQGVVVEYKTRWGRKKLDAVKVFQYKIQALTQAMAANAGVAVLHITTIPYKTTTNDVKNELWITDAKNSPYAKIIKRLMTGAMSREDVHTKQKVTRLNAGFDVKYDDTDDLRSYVALFDKFNGQAGQRYFSANKKNKTLYYKPSSFSALASDAQIVSELDALSDVLHSCMVTI